MDTPLTEPRPMLEFRGVRKTFGTRVALQDLHLTVRAGEVFGLLGPNGAGKSTAVSLAVGLLVPDAGEVRIAGGEDPRNPDARRHLGVAPQALALYEELTGQENLTFFGRLQGLRGPRLAERVADSLDFVGLATRRHDRVAKYSGGMKRRLNIAAALLHEPGLILLDEPTVGVDPQSRNSIFENIERLKKDGRAIVYTTHYMEEAHRLCDRVGILDQGAILGLDTVEGLLRRHGSASVVFAELTTGEVRLETADPVGALAEFQARGHLRSFRVAQPDLESVFLELTGRQLRD